MERITVAPRADWRDRAEALGFSFHSLGGETYWTEDAAYRLTETEVERLEGATQALENTCLDFVDETVQRGDYDAYGYTDDACAMIEASWQRQDKNLYGRFDFVFGPDGQPKMLEYNADTPTALFEASVVQWDWLQSHFPAGDQFNSLHERLIDAWRHFGLFGHRLHFSCLRDNVEDKGTVDYLRQTATLAGLDTDHIFIEDIGWNGRRFVDLAEQPITRLFKLYPWEWLFTDAFAPHLRRAEMRFIEPAWKMLLSTKALLPLLWRRWPDHPHLLPASFDAGDMNGPLMRKPVHGREGEGVLRLLQGQAAPAETGDAGNFLADRFVYQAAIDMPCFDGRYPVLGSWVVASQASGLGIREDATPITRNSSRFVPHFFA